MTSRIEQVFANARAENRGTLGVFVTAGDPDIKTSTAILDAVVEAGADIIELGMPFSDPMADGPAIQAASLRALKRGMTLESTLKMAAVFRERNPETPLVLMGYYNPIYIYGVQRFLDACVVAGVDGLIIVDLPPEEDDELCIPARAAGIDFIRLVTPTSDTERLPVVLSAASGFVYYVSITGITGTGSAAGDSISAAYKRISAATNLPIVTGFGIRTPEAAAQAATLSDGAVVGSAVVDIIAENLAEDGSGTPEIVSKIAAFVSDLAKAIAGKAG
ncbi:tryptophan synthase subunit alpha [Alphaproteobacteria bacterium]|jgi:tryptophan synthase alpha chain|nr:tryptophan synthase subunit alpha [Alphaproteobacteria bacterium]NCF49574.1 tryptophan synthase subunit alpha [Bacteroidota bacterium]